jgi:hypothetical protein
MNIEITEEIIDGILKTELKNSINDIKRDIKNLKKISKREKYQDEDLSYDQELLPHLEAVYNYFGGNLKHKSF